MQVFDGQGGQHKLEAYLAAGRAGEALALYRGSLLTTSDLPFLNEWRERLEEGLRQCVLANGDPDDLFALAQQLKHDLELWDAAVKSLEARRDPRVALAKTRQKELVRDYEL